MQRKTLNEDKKTAIKKRKQTLKEKADYFFAQNVHLASYKIRLKTVNESLFTILRKAFWDLDRGPMSLDWIRSTIYDENINHSKTYVRLKFAPYVGKIFDSQLRSFFSSINSDIVIGKTGFVKLKVPDLYKVYCILTDDWSMDLETFISKYYTIISYRLKKLNLNKVEKTVYNNLYKYFIHNNVFNYNNYTEGNEIKFEFIGKVKSYYNVYFIIPGINEKMVKNTTKMLLLNEPITYKLDALNGKIFKKNKPLVLQYTIKKDKFAQLAAYFKLYSGEV